MARADSTIRVNIIGDAKGLQQATAKAEGAVGGLNKQLLKVGAGIGAAFVADQVIDFANTAVKEADRVADATGQITAQLGPELSQALIDRADDFTDLGQSRGDMLELEKRIIDIGTASGATDEQLAPMAENLALAAAKMALIDTEGRDANYWIELIGKAAGGAKKPLQELGVDLDAAAVNQQALADTGKTAVDQLTEEEIFAARVKVIMEQLNPKIKDVTASNADLEQKQAAVNAKWEQLTGEIGGPLTDLLEEVLGFVLAGVEGWQMLSEKIGGFDKAISDALTPVARMIDAQRELIGVIATAIGMLNDLLGMAGQVKVGRATGGNDPVGDFFGFGGGGNVTVQVNGGSPEVIEQQVRAAIRHATGRGPLE